MSNVHHAITKLGEHHDLNHAQYRWTKSAIGIVSNEKLLAIYRWAQSTSQEYAIVRTFDPIALTAETIICEELLGLTKTDAVEALLAAKSVKDLVALRPTNSN
jgi:hypothetical protein